MKDRQLAIEPLLELRCDIIMPGRCEKAGVRKPESEWLLLFPGLSKPDWDVWFEEVKANFKTPVNQKWQLVNEIFKSRGLHSISYIQAAVDCITEWEKRIEVETNVDRDTTGLHI